MKDKNRFGVKIKNFQAGAVYQCNIGVRKNYDYTKAMFSNSLLLYFLKDNGLIIENGWTRDVICMEFDYGSRSFDEEKKHIEKLIKETEDNEQKEFYQSLLSQTITNKDLFDKKSADEIRTIFYENGVEIRHDVRTKKDKKVKEEFVHYRMLFRSTGKAKQGSCMFICDRLYDKAINFIRMGLDMDKDNAPIVEMGAYSSLIASSIVGTIKINPKNILILNDVDSFFETNVVSIDINQDGQCTAIPKSNYRLKNTMFDGQGLIDESIFPNWGDGYVLLREHMCKMACFKTKIQKFFKDYYGDQYQTAQIEDMFGNKHYVKDIELITTDNAVKWLKFGVSYDYWCQKVNENGNLFGAVKTAHKSKLGAVQKMSYQMINSLDIDIMPNVVETSVEYINKLKQDDDFFLQYLKENENYSNDYKVLVALCEYNKEFIRSEYFRDRKYKIIEQYIVNFRFGKVIQNADNLVFVGSPYAMLLHTVGEDVEKDPTFKSESDAIECFTTRFADGEYLAGFRSPHNSKNNILHLHNVYAKEFFDYFDLGKQIIALNTLHTDVQDRANGCDFDSDSGFITNQTQIVESAKRAYLNFPTIVNNIPKSKNIYSNSLENFAVVDNKLAKAQSAIGTSSNIAQIAQTYMYSFPSEQKYKDYVCILSVLAQVAIDNAKRTFDVDLVGEIKRISKEMNIDENGYPTFWKIVKDKKAKVGDKKFDGGKINKNLKCPMNYLAELKFGRYRSSDSTLPMDYFFQKFEMKEDRRKSVRVEKLIEKYMSDLFKDTKVNFSNAYSDYGMNEDWILLEIDYDELLEDLKTTYLSNDYIGLESWIIDRAFLISNSIKSNKSNIQSITSKNKSLLIKILYDINSKNILKIFSKNMQ